MDGTPVRGGLRDPRFGPSAGIACATCHATCAKPCNGHFGHYTLTEPLYNVHFVKHVIVWLRLVCGSCGEVQVDAVDRRGVLALTQWREKQCRKCHAPLLRSVCWDKEQQTLMVADDEQMTAKEALRRFRLVPDNHPLFCAGSKLVHPRRLITSVVFVPSICLRPCVGGRNNSDVRGENDITYRLAKSPLAPSCSRKRAVQQRFHFASLRASLVRRHGYIDANDQAQRELGRRISKSTSRCRTCFAGKRAFQAIWRGSRIRRRGRHSLLHDLTPRVGVPKWMCDEMSVPVKVTEWNLSGLQPCQREKSAVS